MEQLEFFLLTELYKYYVLKPNLDLELPQQETSAPIIEIITNNERQLLRNFYEKKKNM